MKLYLSLLTFVIVAIASSAFGDDLSTTLPEFNRPSAPISRIADPVRIANPIASMPVNLPIERRIDPVGRNPASIPLDSNNAPSAPSER